MYSFKNPVSHQCHVLCILYIVQLRISVTSPLPRSFLHTFCDIPHAKVSQLSRPHQKMLVLSSDAGRSWGRRACAQSAAASWSNRSISRIGLQRGLDPVLVLTAAECDTLILPSLKCPLFYGASQHFSSHWWSGREHGISTTKHRKNKVFFCFFKNMIQNHKLE